METPYEYLASGYVMLNELRLSGLAVRRVIIHRNLLTIVSSSWFKDGVSVSWYQWSGGRHRQATK